MGIIMLFCVILSYIKTGVTSLFIVTILITPIIVMIATMFLLPFTAKLDIDTPSDTDITKIED